MGQTVSARPLQSVTVPGSEKEGWGVIHRAVELGDKPLQETLYPDVTTLHENFEVRGGRALPGWGFALF